MNKLVAYKADVNGLIANFYRFEGNTEQPENYPEGIKEKLADGYAVLPEKLADTVALRHCVNVFHSDFLTKEQQQNWGV